MDAEFYELDGKRYGRITKALEACPSPDLIEWKIELIKKFSRELSREDASLSIEELLDKAIRKMNKIGDDAAEIGQNVDAYLKAKINGEELPKLKKFEDRSCVEAFEKWECDHPEVKLSVPPTVYDDELMIAGTPDFEDEDTVYDLKGANEIRRKNWLQTEFYARKRGKKFKAIIRVDRDLGIYEFKKFPISDDDWEMVKSVVNMYRYYKKGEIL